jgi:hypothetical protein
MGCPDREYDRYESVQQERLHHVECGIGTAVPDIVELKGSGRAISKSVADRRS